MQVETLQKNQIESKTIADFGEQWTSFTENEGYYGSSEVLADIFGPLQNLDDLKGKVIADVGCGNGRLVHILCRNGVKKVYAIEPSPALDVAKTYCKPFGDVVEYVPLKGDEWQRPDVDLIICIGVLHHIYDPVPVLQNFYKNLRPGGKILCWMYGHEGNETYLRIFQPIRAVTTKVPHWILNLVASALVPFLKLYSSLCRVLPLPMRTYMLEHVAKLDTQSQKITIYDQLNPAWAKYYKKQEIRDLFAQGGFQNVDLYHRHGYSWTIAATK